MTVLLPQQQKASEEYYLIVSGSGLSRTVNKIHDHAAASKMIGNLISKGETVTIRRVTKEKGA